MEDSNQSGSDDLEEIEQLIPSDSQSGLTPILYTRRWLFLVTFFFQTVVNAVAFITFGPINVTAAEFFLPNATETSGVVAVNVQSGVGTFYGVFLMIPCLWLVKRFGLRVTMVGCSVVSVVGGLLRIAIPFLPISSGAYFWLIFVSQVIVMLANPALTALPSEISAHWFSVSERAVATSVGSLGTLVGLAAGYSLSGFLIGNDVSVPRSVLADRFLYLFVAQGAALVVFGIPGFFFQDHPPTPPSVSGQDHSNNGMSLSMEIKYCLWEPAFLPLVLLLGVGYGLFVGIWTTMQQLVGSTELSAYIGIAMVGAGVVGSAVAGLILDKWRCYRAVLLSGAPAGVAGLTLFYVGLIRTPISSAWLIGSSAFSGVFLIPLVPAVFETATEVTFPANESTRYVVCVLSFSPFAFSPLKTKPLL